MTPTEERHCHNCGSFHLRNVSFFSYWTQCKECGTYSCPRCSGYNNARVTQFSFLGYLLITFIIYFGIFLIIASSYLIAAVLLFVPFLFLLLIIRSAIRRLSQMYKGTLPNCPKCQGQMRVVYHDIFLYFWLFLIHVLFIGTIANEVGIIFYKLDDAGVSLGLFLVYLLVGIIIFIIWLFKRIGGRFMISYKTNRRVWLGETFAITIYIGINVILILSMKSITNIIPLPQLFNDTIVSFNLFYSFASIVLWYFPAFLIGSIIYRIAQKYLLNTNRSTIIQIVIALIYIIIPFFLWGFISLQLNIYQYSSEVPFYTALNEILPLYSTIFNEMIPILLTALLLGTCIGFLFRKFFVSPRISKKLVVVLGAFAIGGFLLFENIYYLFSGALFLDNLPSSITLLILIIVITGILILLIYELLSNWASPQTRLGQKLEKYLGSLLYPVLMGFIFFTLAFSFSAMVFMSSSTTIIPIFTLTADIFSLKLIFVISFLCGVVLGVKKIAKSD